MGRIGIIVDSASSIKGGEYNDVYVIPLIIIENNNGKEVSYCDEVDLSFAAMLDKIDGGANLKTSQIPMGVMIEQIEKINDKYDDIFVIPLTKHISGNYNSWKLLEQDYKKIHVLDAEDVGPGIKWTVEDILKFAQEGKSVDQIIKYVEDVKQKRSSILFVDDISCLVRGGRLSGFKGMIVKILGLKILIKFRKNLTFFNKARNMESAIKKAYDEINNDIHFVENGINRIAFYQMSNDKKFLEETEKNVKKFFPKIKEFSRGHLSSVITVHTGGNSFAIYIESK